MWYPDSEASSDSEDLIEFLENPTTRLALEAFEAGVSLSDPNCSIKEGTEEWLARHRALINYLAHVINNIYEEGTIGDKKLVLIGRLAECRKENDPNKLIYLIKPHEIHLWSVDLVLSAEKDEFRKNQDEPFEWYKQSLDETIKSMYEYVKSCSCACGQRGSFMDYERRTNVISWGKPQRQVRFKYLDTAQEFADNPSDPVSIKATHLLALYSHDKRFPRLASMIKLWKSSRFDLFDTAKAFSSYAFMLMLIHYLQKGCQPPVLPCLHEDYPEVFEPHLSTSNLRDLSIKFTSENNLNLGELLDGFLKFYSDGFDYRKTKVSIRSSKPKPLTGGDSSMFFIEDPITQENVVRDVPYSGPENYGKLTKLGTKNMSEILAEIFALTKENMLKKSRTAYLLTYDFD